MEKTYLDAIRELVEYSDIEKISINKCGDGKVEIFDGDKYVGRFLITKNSKLVWDDGVFYYNGIPCEVLDENFIIPSKNQIDAIYDYPFGTYYIFAQGNHENLEYYISGKTISGDLKLRVLQPFYA